MQNYSIYYQVHVIRKTAWFVSAVLKSFDHLCFDRTYDVENSIFEFLVPADNEKAFLEIMQYLQKENKIADLKKLPNRFKN